MSNLDSDIPALPADSPDCAWVLPELETSPARIQSNYNAGAQTVTGSYPPFQDIRSISVADGRFYDWGDVKEVRRVAFLGTEVKKQLFGGRNPIGDNIYLNDIPYKVIGVMKTGSGLQLRRVRYQQSLCTVYGNARGLS